LAKDARFLIPSRRRIAYVGWNGHRNMGDEAIFEVSKRSFASYKLVDAPWGSRFDRIARHRQAPTIAAGLLGGGTTVGRYRTYRLRFERWFGAYPELPAFALGVGIVDPGFERGLDGFDAEGELRAWADVLRRFEVVTVRGPDSRRALAEVGIPSSVVGDPALMVGPKRLPSPREQLLGLNVGFSARASNIDWDMLLPEVIAAAKVLVDRGWRVRLTPMHDSDVALSRAVARALGERVELVRRWRSLPRLLHAIGECEVLVGTKLHSVVFAAAAGVPAVSLAYEPKCLDFQRSIGREPFTLRLPDIRSGSIVDLVDHLSRDRDRESRAVTDAVEARRNELTRTIRTIRERLP
jgi:hypothetical protein